MAVLPIHGLITQRGQRYTGTSTIQFGQWLQDAVVDTNVSQILIDVDSSGGGIYGVVELADAIFQARKVKPVVAAINSQASSAAYWLASQASKVYITPGGEVGGIGVWNVHEDHSGALELLGVDVTLITAGKYKTEGHPYGPLSNDAKAYMQQRTADYYSTFTKHVARGRGVTVDQVRGGMGQGRSLGAFWAFAEKMVDGIRTFDAVLRDMGGAVGARSVAAAGRPSSLGRVLQSKLNESTRRKS